MKPIYTIILIFSILFFVNCSVRKYTDISQNWASAAKMEEIEIFVDTTSIKQMGTMLIAKEKKVFYSKESKEKYIASIQEKYSQLKGKDNSHKWADFSYSIYVSEYDCLNNRLRILSIEDYDSNGERIVKTTTNKEKLVWKDVDPETIGDYTFFFVCDYGH